LAGGAPECLVIRNATDWGPESSAARALAAAGLTPEEAEGRIETFTTDWRWPFFNWAWPPGFVERRYEWGYYFLQRCHMPKQLVSARSH
jgi:hypothetical protein